MSMCKNEQATLKTKNEKIYMGKKMIENLIYDHSKLSVCVSMHSAETQSNGWAKCSTIEAHQRIRSHTQYTAQTDALHTHFNATEATDLRIAFN